MAPPVRQTRLRTLMLMLTALLALLIGASSATASPQATADASGVEGQTYVIATDTMTLAANDGDEGEIGDLDHHSVPPGRHSTEPRGLLL